MPTSDAPTTNPTRELAAIMFSDIAGYTAIMGRDEARAMDALAEHRALLRTLLPKFNGRMIGEIGDGTLSSFHSALGAVNCAREVQAALEGKDEFRVRIGIHVGDVLFSNNDVHGDGVNVASRIHALAAPGGICISERVYEDVRNKPEIRVRDLGEKRLKNVSRPIRVYALATTALPDQPRTEQTRSMARALVAGAGALLLIAALGYGVARWRSFTPGSAEQPATQARVIRSIAVLPLDNFSGDSSQEYFADGMTDELTTDLAKISALRVISRGSVMQYKGAHRPPTPEIAKALNVDAVVEGSVVRSGDRVRITAQLIDAPADKHLWADSYERDSRDVLALQDELALAIARQINIELTPQEQVHFASARQVDPEAYDAYLKGRYYLDKYTPDDTERAMDYFSQAIKADPQFPGAYVGLGRGYTSSAFFLPGKDAMPKAREAAEKALELGDADGGAHYVLSIVKYRYDFDWPGAEVELQRAIALAPSSAGAHSGYGFLLTMEGRFEQAEAELKRATELDPLNLTFTLAVGRLFELQGQYEKAAEQFRKVLAMDPNFEFAHFALGATEADRQTRYSNSRRPRL
jgi:adenylate cyclase